MLFKQLVCGVLAVSGASAVALKGDKDLSDAGLEWTLRKLDREVGDLKWERPHEAETFDIGSILGEFYDQVGMKYGDSDYGTFYHHGAYYKYGIKPIGSHEAALHDWDFGIGDHGTPENVHNHFDYQGGFSGWNPFPVPAAGPTNAGVYYDGGHGAGYRDEAAAVEEPQRPKFEYTVPEVRYEDPKPYSYSVTNPSIVYREIEHVRPPKYESPVPTYDHFYPEGYTNEYDDYYIDAYFGSDGSDHSHYRYDNWDEIDLNHGHFDPDPYAKVRPFQPEADSYFVPQVTGAVFEANYSGNLDPKAAAKAAKYYDPELGVYFSLYDNSLVPGQAYEAQDGSHHDNYIPAAYVEQPDGSTQLYEEEVIPTEVIYENPVVGESVVTEITGASNGGYPA